MKQIPLRDLYKNLGKHLEELPFEITNHNKVVAVVSKSQTTVLPGEVLVDGGKSTERLVSKMPAKKSVVNGVCKHGKFGYCVEGCFK